MELGKLVSFDGRIGRGAFWGLLLVNAVIGVIIELIAFKAGGIGAAIGILLLLALFVVSLATQIKRWHDRGKSGWWILISLVPVIGGLWALIETGFLAGTEGPNAYGLPSSGSPFADSTPVPTQTWIN
jgi:uncharacterized membrane protein YhaH (DUF805 family)